ncbi:MAG: N-acetylmuramic acid 6-phosphate etherase, partial [Plesiomonas sp.]
MNLGRLVSESRNSNTMDLDTLPTVEMLQRFNEEDQRVPLAVKQELPAIA